MRLLLWQRSSLVAGNTQKPLLQTGAYVLHLLCDKHFTGAFAMQFKILFARGKLLIAVKIDVRLIIALISVFSQ